MISQFSIIIENVTIRSILLRKRPTDLSTINNSQPIVIYTKGKTYDWIDKLKSTLNCEQIDKDNKIWLICSESYRSGLIGLALSLKEETFGHRIRAILSPGFDHQRDEETFKQLRQKDLLINVQVNHEWGTYRHIEIELMDEVKVEDQSAYLAWTSTDQSKLSWFKCPPIVANNETIFNYYSTFNQCLHCDNQSLLSSNRYHLNCNKIGWDFAGYSSDGKKVFGKFKLLTIS